MHQLGVVEGPFWLEATAAASPPRRGRWRGRDGGHRRVPLSAFPGQPEQPPASALAVLHDGQGHRQQTERR